ncbi:MAG: MBL fold metallo-hydrolase [Rhodospirillaceae bacterium]|nr:MAG: MBL fold metallo-hydrolase [Rhodospirillaceae bacterium]
MRVRILGCGGSGGVPLIGNDWGACDPKNPKNSRLRASILVEDRETALLVDTSPDLRAQLLAAGTERLDGVLFTHTHADHIHGIDDLRPVNRRMGAWIPIYADRETLAAIEARFGYVLEKMPEEYGFFKPCLTPNLINGPFRIGNIDVLPFEQDHGFGRTSLGFRFGPIAYSTDVVGLSEAAFESLRGVRLWIVDCLRDRSHPTHSHLAQTLAWIKRVAPERAVLTHMNQDADYETLARSLPDGVEPAYDGMVLDVPS